MDVLPADALLARSAIPMNPMANAANPGEGFDIQMQEVARMGPLVALDDGRRLERTQPIQASPRQHARDRRPRDAERGADLPARGPRLTQRDDLAVRSIASCRGDRRGRDDRSSNIRSPARPRAVHLATVRTLTPAASAARDCVQPWTGTRSIINARVRGVVFALP